MAIGVTLAFGAVIILEIAIPLILGRLVVKRFGLPWSIFLYGALFFIISQAIHIPLLLIIQQPYTAWVQSVASDPHLILGAVAIFLGLFAGVLEEGVRYLVFTRFFPRKSIPLTRERGLLFGTGWGGIECIFVAVLGFFSLVNYLLITSGAFDAILANVTVNDQYRLALEALMTLSPLDVLAGLVERMMALILQITFTLMVLFAVVRERLLVLVAVAGWHAVIDAVAVYAGQLHGIWPTEGFIALNAVVGIAILAWIWKSIGREEQTGSSEKQE